MKTAVIFYSWSGHTKALAQEKARLDGAALFEIEDEKRPGALKAYTAGCLAALRMKPALVKPFHIPFEAFDRIVIMAPVWAGHPAPAVNALWSELPAGKDVCFCAVSASGSSSCRDKVKDIVNRKGCMLSGYEDICAK